MYWLCVNVYCHRVTTQLQLINISYLTCEVENVLDYIHFGSYECLELYLRSAELVDPVVSSYLEDAGRPVIVMRAFPLFFYSFPVKCRYSGLTL